MQLQQHMPASLIATTGRKSRSTGDLVGLSREMPPMGAPGGLAEVIPPSDQLPLQFCSSLMLIMTLCKIMDERTGQDGKYWPMWSYRLLHSKMFYLQFQILWIVLTELLTCIHALRMCKPEDLWLWACILWKSDKEGKSCRSWRPCSLRMPLRTRTSLAAAGCQRARPASAQQWS